MTIWLALALLVVGGLALIALPDAATSMGRTRHRAVGGVLSLILLALGVWLGPDVEMASGELAQDHLGRLAVGVMLIASAIRWPNGQSRGEMGRRLLVIAGGVMAVSANSLLTLWIGLLLFLLETHISALLDNKWFLVSILATLGGITMLYTATGALHLDVLGRYLGLHAGPQSIACYVGLALLVLGISMASSLLGPSSATAKSQGTRMLWGLVLLLRIAGHLPTMWWEWRWLLGTVALAQAIITLDHWLLHGAHRSWDGSWMLMLQGVMVLLGLALCQTPLGLMAALGLMLTLLLIMVGWRLLNGLGIDLAQSEQCAGLIYRKPGLGIALGVSVLSLAGLPLTLGFQARVLLTQSLAGEGTGWLLWSWVAALCLFGALHVPNLVALLERDQRSPSAEHLSWAQLTLYAVAAALVLLGLSAMPLAELARWLLVG